MSAPTLADSLTVSPTSGSTRIVSLPLDPQIVTAHYRITTIEMVVLELTDSEGRSGFSTLWCFGVPQAQVLRAMIEYLAPIALGNRADAPEHPAAIASICARIRAEINFFGFKGVSVFGLAAYDMALHDLACRAAGLPISGLLGRKRDSVPAYWSGLFLNQSEEELVEEVDRMRERGFRAMKLRMGKPDLAEDIRRVEAVLGRLGPAETLMVDAVQSWSVEQAIEGARALADYGVRWLEDPLVHDDHEGLRAVVEASPVPIAQGENEYLSEGFAELLDCGPDYLLADLQRTGGVREWQRIAELARGAGAAMTPHVYPQIATQLCSALDQDERWVEYIPWWDSLTGSPPELHDGAFVVGDRPGLGLDLDPELLDERTVMPSTPLPSSGSVA